jgi:dihydropteroate synthase
LSIDTSKAEVARRCLAAGAAVVNDVTGLCGDPDMVGVVREHRAGAIVMHMRGTPATMQLDTHYDDVVAEVVRFLEERLHFLVGQGISPSCVALDPGVGFGKTHEHNLTLVARLADLQRLGRPVCLGVSRKGFIGKVLGREINDRMAGSVAVACLAACRGTAQILRVHDVRETADAVRLLHAIDARSHRA